MGQPDFQCAGDDHRMLGKDQIWSVASFDAGWYSDMLGCDMAFHAIAAADEEGYSIGDHFAETNAFLSRCRSEGRRGLGHCVMGINRAPTAVIAFLCDVLGMGLRDAVELASSRRGYILSNGSFIDQ